MFRKRGGASQDGRQQVDELLQQDAPLDEGEQERVVQEFEEMQLQNTRMWRRTFAAGGRGQRLRCTLASAPPTLRPRPFAPIRAAPPALRA
jgi:hypothetical protein